MIAYFLSNISAKNYQNRLMCVEVIVYNMSVIVIFRHTVVSKHITSSSSLILLQLLVMLYL